MADLPSPAKIRMQIVLDPGIEQRLRETAARVKGLRKGSLSEAVEEAIAEWLQKNDSHRRAKS